LDDNPLAMTTTSGSIQTSTPKNAIFIIAIAGLLSGTLDGLGAIIWSYLKSGVTPDIVFKYIASGFFGKEAFAGGTSMILFGVLFHYIIATGWSILLFFLYPTLIQLLKNKFVVGIIYGIVIWVVMNLLVVPNSNVPQGKGFDLVQFAINMSILIVAVGIPISLVMHRYRQ
jgi:hypothetical protein